MVVLLRISANALVSKMLVEMLPLIATLSPEPQAEPPDELDDMSIVANIVPRLSAATVMSPVVVVRSTPSTIATASERTSLVTIIPP